MNHPGQQEKLIADICTHTEPEPDHQTLLDAVSTLFPDYPFRHVLTRAGWYRMSGIVDQGLQRIAMSIRDWVEAECAHDMFALYERFAASDYLTTRFDGQTHYFVAPLGSRSTDFIQLEVEEIVEVTDRPLFGEDDIPDDVEELLDPPGAAALRVAPQVVAPARYVFRELTDVAELIADHVGSEGSDLRYIRFLEEWDRSSAGRQARFCEHFVLRMLPFRDRFGESKIEATPLPVTAFEEPDISATQLSGKALADFLHRYDKRAGFPMAWYFAMPVMKKTMACIAQTVQTDAQRNYRYLPERDLEILEGWVRKPYSF